MPSKKAYSSSSFSSSSSTSSQLSTPRAFHNGSSRPIAKSPIWDVEKVNCSYNLSIPKVSQSSEELKDEILVLEVEIIQLERYLLSLYRKSFGDHLSSSLFPDEFSQCLKIPPSKTEFRNDRASQSLPETNKIERPESGHPSLADLLGLNTLSPNKLSEEIVRVICEIYLKLSDKGHSNLVKNEIINKEYGHAHGVVIHHLCLDDENLETVESLLHNFRSLVLKLEKVNPERMAREEKLAFWVNIHHALVMHGYIVYIYGTSEGRRSRMIMKASINIGGEWVNAYDVQSSILRIPSHHSTSRFGTLFLPARSSKRRSSLHNYALEYTEPLLHFALSTGASTDPMVQVYTAEGIFQELRQARDIFIRTSVMFENDTFILLPKIFNFYAKDTTLDMPGLFNILSECLLETQRAKMVRVLKKKKDKCIRWINHDSSFPYIIDICKTV